MESCEVCGRVNWTVQVHASGIAPASAMYCAKCDEMAAEPAEFLESMVEDPHYFEWVDLSPRWTWEDGQYVTANDWLAQHGGGERAAFPRPAEETLEEVARSVSLEWAGKKWRQANIDVSVGDRHRRSCTTALVGFQVGDVESRLELGEVPDAGGMLRCSLGVMQAIAVAELLVRTWQEPDVAAVAQAVKQEPTDGRVATDPVLAAMMRAIAASMPYDEVSHDAACAVYGLPEFGLDEVPEDALAQLTAMVRRGRRRRSIRREFLARTRLPPSVLGDVVEQTIDLVAAGVEDEPPDVLRRAAHGDDHWPGQGRLQGTLTGAMLGLRAEQTPGWTAHVHGPDLERALAVGAELAKIVEPRVESARRLEQFAKDVIGVIERERGVVWDPYAE